MAWMLVNPQLHNAFAGLGSQRADGGYDVGTDCLHILHEVLSKLAMEDRSLRTFRRAIGFGQNIRNDLLPLLVNVRDDDKATVDATKIIDATIKILVNLTIPVECLLCTEAMSRTDVGRHTIFELNNLLITSKEAFLDSRSTRAVVDHMKHFVERDRQLSVEQCDSINNCLLLLRNILHIPENRQPGPNNCPLAYSSMQNQILWNLFTQSIDKMLIHLMSCPQKIYWNVTLVQLIALIYKDQHVGTLQKLLNMWFEASLSESSEDNESNTSPPDQGSGDSSPMLTSDPTSDSSDNGGSGKSKGNQQKNQNNSKTLSEPQKQTVRCQPSRNKAKNGAGRPAEDASSSFSSDSKVYPLQKACIRSRVRSGHTQDRITSRLFSTSSQTTEPAKKMDTHSEMSDCGYGTQVENQESISTSSNDDDSPQQKPVHQKPHMVQKSRYNGKPRAVTIQEKKELRRKKLVKRSKTNMINVKGLMHHSPTDDDISNVLKEFTVDFLLKGYSTLVHDLHAQLMTNIHIQIDTSHFFWLVTYFLKFAAQLELDYEHINTVLSYDIISYLVYEGVNLSEQLQLGLAQPGTDMKPCLRRLHLAVTAIREFLEALNVYKKVTHLSKEDQSLLLKLRLKIAETEDLKCLFVLLLRQFDPNLHSKQYLQDVIVTNHILLVFLDETSRMADYKGHFSMVDHLKQFASVEVMHKYGLLFEDFRNNGEFVNDCIFTMMHHIGGDLNNISTLFQPSILKTFSQIWETDYEICDDWSDLIEYVIHKFINTPRHDAPPITEGNIAPLVAESPAPTEEWSREDKDNLQWYYMQCRAAGDSMLEDIANMFTDGGVDKAKVDIIRQLLAQSLIDRALHDDLLKKENCTEKPPREGDLAEIKEIRDILHREDRQYLISWLQRALIETSYSKIMLEGLQDGGEHIMEPVPRHYAALNQSVPLVPWSPQISSGLDQKLFTLLLYKLGFHLPSDTGKIFFRIPNYWTAEFIFNIAEKLGPIDTTRLKFDLNLLRNVNDRKFSVETMRPVPYSNFEQSLNLARSKTIVKFTPMPNPFPEWYETVIHSKDILPQGPPVPRSDPLTISIPHVEMVNLPAPEIALVATDDSHQSRNDMDCAERVEDDELEGNTIIETASVASDLTRMYVSDEEEKHMKIN